jgi:putative ATP-dependent endonuclease of OLD family
MYLRSLKLNNFRSCASATIDFHSVLTVIAGENNGGKTNVLDALRLVTAPSDTRRARTFETADLRLGAESLKLSMQYSDLDPCQRGLFFTALRNNESDEALYQLSWTPPIGRARRRWATWTVGASGSSEIEPDVRDLVRHVHLPALRDADRDLASSSPGRIEFLLRQLLAGKDAERDALLDSVKSASVTLLAQAPLIDARDRVHTAFTPLSEGFLAHHAYLRFADASLVGLARDLRFSLSQAGMDPTRVLQTGLGYSNLLYLASVLVELEAARDAELTLLLVEEPEAHLHPQLQHATLAFLAKKAQESARRTPQPGERAGRIQVIVSTHSPNLTAATSIKQMVVLRTRPGSPPPPQEPSAEAESSWPAEGAERLAEPTWAEPAETYAIAVGGLNLPSPQQRKIDRYLDVTKSSLLFGRNVLLVEGIAEALIIPALAPLVLEGAELARFTAASVVAIDGVDFEPYVRLLLTSPQGCQAPIADRVVVVTDQDPGACAQAEGDEGDASSSEATRESMTTPRGDSRKESLAQLVASLGASERFHVEVTPLTLEASLLSDSPAPEVASWLVCSAFAACEGGSQRAKEWPTKIAAHGVQERGKRFVQWMKSTGTRKGDFAQALAEVIAEQQTAVPPRIFPVPSHLARAIRRLVGSVTP